MLRGGTECRPAAAVCTVLCEQLAPPLSNLAWQPLELARSRVNDALLAGRQPLRKLLPLLRTAECPIACMRQT